MDKSSEIYDSQKDYIVKNVESAIDVHKKTSKGSLFQKIMLAVNFILFSFTLDSNLFPSWVPVVMGSLNIFGIFVDIGQNGELYRSWAYQDRLGTRYDLSKISENGGSIDDARDYVVEKIEDLEEKIDNMMVPKTVLLITSGLLAVYTILVMMGIVPNGISYAKLPILSAIFGEFALHESNKKSVYEQRIDELQTTLDLDEVKRSRRK